MSHLRVLICRVEESGDEQMTELACVDLPPTAQHRPEVLLDQLEETVAERGCHILQYLYELAWEELDAQAVASYRASHAPGAVVADGYAPLRVASRFGLLQLRRQVCVHPETNGHVLPGNTLLPRHHGMLITRGLTEWACLLSHELPFASVARLLGWQTSEPEVLSATMVRTLVRDHGERIRRIERTQVQALFRQQPLCLGQRLQGAGRDDGQAGRPSCMGRWRRHWGRSSAAHRRASPGQTGSAFWLPGGPRWSSTWRPCAD